MKLFTKEFLDKLYKEYEISNELGMLDLLIHINKMSFHEAIVFMAEGKGMIPEYIKSKETDEHTTEHPI